MQTQSRPVLRLAMLLGGLFLTYLGGSALIASRYVSHGVLDTSWYVQSIGSLVSGLALTLGPQLKTAGTELLKQWWPQLFNGGVTPTPGPNGPSPSPNMMGWINSLLNGGQLPDLVINSPEANFLTLLLLAKFAKSVGNKPLQNSLRTAALALFDTFFPSATSMEAPNVSITPVSVLNPGP